MSKQKPIHSGHRQRLKDKFISAKETFSEHEILELLLFYSIPRKNTNDIAHKLIDTFGSLSEILKADVNSLKLVDGLGENSAIFLNLLGYVNKLTNISSNTNFSLSTISDAKQRIISLFKDANHEIFYVIYLNKKDLVTKIEKFDSGDKTKVLVNLQELTKSVILNNPTSIIVCHNHFSKYPKPSADDDRLTAKLIYLLNSLKVNFYDHLIVSGEETYSYFYDNRLQLIKEKIKNEIL